MKASEQIGGRLSPKVEDYILRVGGHDSLLARDPTKPDSTIQVEVVAVDIASRQESGTNALSFEGPAPSFERIVGDSDSARTGFENVATVSVGSRAPKAL